VMLAGMSARSVSGSRAVIRPLTHTVPLCNAQHFAPLAGQYANPDVADLIKVHRTIAVAWALYRIALKPQE
jgi:hypothetical protein